VLNLYTQVAAVCADCCGPCWDVALQCSSGGFTWCMNLANCYRSRI